MQESKSILITGCSSGIGLSAARLLKARGYRVFASARQIRDVQRLQEEGFEALQLDLDDETSIELAVTQVLDWADGSLDALFNNGGFGQPGAVEDISRATLLAQLQTNLLGWHDLTRRLIPVMRRQGHGRIIQNSSILGFAPMPYRGAYNCAKFALEGLTDTLRLELKGSGIQVSLIEPGPILSRFRVNALQKLKDNINMDDSIHRTQYRAAIQRLASPGPAVPFTLPAEAVVRRLIHALESRHPRARYYVTVPTYLFACLKRLLPTRMMDWMLIKASGEGSR